jgi:hypothetical protein
LAQFSRGLISDSPGKWPSALCGASMTLASPSCDDQLPEGEAYTDSATLRGAILQGRVSCQSWVSSLAFRLRLTRPSCSGVLTPSCAPSYLTGLSAAARSDGCRPHHYRRANKAVAIHQSKKPTGESGFMCRRHVARESSLASLICLETCRSRISAPLPRYLLIPCRRACTLRTKPADDRQRQAALSIQSHWPLRSVGR